MVDRVMSFDPLPNATSADDTSPMLDRAIGEIRDYMAQAIADAIPLIAGGEESPLDVLSQIVIGAWYHKSRAIVMGTAYDADTRAVILIVMTARKQEMIANIRAALAAGYGNKLGDYLQE